MAKLFSLAILMNEIMYRVSHVRMGGRRLQHLGYVGIFLALFFEAIGVPFPSETILITSGIEMSRGVFSFIPLWVMAFMGNVIGSNIAYALGRFVGRSVILRYGRWVGITEPRFHAVEVNFRRFQSAYLFIGKFIAFIRIAIPYLAGINKVTFGKFTLYNFPAAMAWSALFLVMGRYLEMIWSHYGTVLLTHWYLTLPVVIIIVALIGWIHKKIQSRLESDE